jgi:hypothetical protein
MYLCGTRVIEDVYCKTVQASKQEKLNLLAAQPADIFQNTLMSEGTVNNNMGNYHNDLG